MTYLNPPCSSLFIFHCSVQFSRSVVSDSLQPHESQHARPPCPPPTPGVHSDSRPSSQWCHPPHFPCLWSIQVCFQLCFWSRCLDHSNTDYSKVSAPPDEIMTDSAEWVPVILWVCSFRSFLNMLITEGILSNLWQGLLITHMVCWVWNLPR